MHFSLGIFEIFTFGIVIFIISNVEILKYILIDFSYSKSSIRQDERCGNFHNLCGSHAIIFIIFGGLYNNKLKSFFRENWPMAIAKLGKTLSSHSENMLNCLDFLAPLNFLKARILKLIFSTRMIYIEYISLLYYNCWKFAKFFSAFCSEQPLKSICIVISIKLLFNSYFWLVFIEFEYSF